MIQTLGNLRLVKQEWFHKKLGEGGPVGKVGTVGRKALAQPWARKQGWTAPPQPAGQSVLRTIGVRSLNRSCKAPEISPPRYGCSE